MAAEIDYRTLPIEWVQEFQAKFLGGIAHGFIIHGAVDDYVYHNPPLKLDAFLAKLLSQSRPLVIFYNCSRGIDFAHPGMRKLFSEATGTEVPTAGEQSDRLLADPFQALPVLERCLLDPNLEGKVALIVEYPELIWPQGDYKQLSERERINLATLRRWATGTKFVRANQPIFLVTQTATDLHSSLRTSTSGVEQLEIPYPDLEQRKAYIDSRIARDENLRLGEEIDAHRFAAFTGGLSRVLIEDICLRAALEGRPIDLDGIRQRKDQIIRQEFGELIEILEPRQGFSAVGGMLEVKDYLTRSVIAPLKGATDRARMPTGVMLAGPPGTGKGQPLHAPVLTPEGWRAMGELRVGDRLMDPVSGGVTRVSGVYPQGEQEVYRLGFSDGSWAECDRSHLWSLSSSPNGDLHVYSLEQLLHLFQKSALPELWLPLTTPVEFAEKTLPLPPYRLGALLGVAQYSPYRRENMRARLQARVDEQAGLEHKLGLTPSSPSAWTEPPASQSRWPALFAPDPEGGPASQGEFIPPAYLLGSSQQRLALLQGMMDTEGRVREGQAEIRVSSARLADGLIGLVQSLGGVADMREEASAPLSLYWVRLSLPSHLSPFQSESKRALLGPGQLPLERRLVRIESGRRQPTQCIKVESTDQLYLTEDYIVTHNTFLVSALAREAGVNVVKLNAGRLLGQYVGNSERNLERALACIRSLVPVLVMIDEIEQQFQRGSKSDGGVERRLFGRILEEMSGASGTRRGDVVWFAATNRVDQVDAALRRPGRFDRIVPILPPDERERWAILHTKLPGINLSPEEGPRVLQATDGYTGADIDGVIVKAQELSMDAGSPTVRGTHLLQALDLIRASVSDETREMIEIALIHCNDLSLVPPKWRGLAAELHATRPAA